MKESLLHYLWKNRMFNLTEIHSTNYQKIKIIHPGFSHQDAGPDFKQAIIKIDEITWAGDVEIHLNSSDWFRHNHHKNPKYQSVILHVVYNHDCEVARNKHEYYPTLELKKFIPQKIIDEYLKLSLSRKVLACEPQLEKISSLQFSSWLSRVATDRLLRKQKNVFELVELCKGNWHEALFRLLAVNFGFKTNAVAFELLARSLPYKYLVKHLNNRLQTYALIFGQAGMLEEEKTDDGYYQALREEYLYLRYKYDLYPIHEKNWNLLRLRPQNFPCLRLAQFCEHLHQNPDFFSRITEGKELNFIPHAPHAYWKTHYHFGKPVKEHNHSIGEKTTELIIINTIVPTLFAYGTFTGNELLQEKAFAALEKSHFEENKITISYKKAGFPANSALYSQAILELHTHYCQPKKCLDCGIGEVLLAGT